MNMYRNHHTDSDPQISIARHRYLWMKIPTTLARINEPVPGGDVNVYTKQEGNTVSLYAERDLLANEELFIDYGNRYDRRNYDDQKDKEDVRDY